MCVDFQVVMKIGYKWGTYLVKEPILRRISDKNQRVTQCGKWAFMNTSDLVKTATDMEYDFGLFDVQ
jgi:hypothetical protein